MMQTWLTGQKKVRHTDTRNLEFEMVWLIGKIAFLLDGLGRPQSHISNSSSALAVGHMSRYVRKLYLMPFAAQRAHRLPLNKTFLDHRRQRLKWFQERRHWHDNWYLMFTDKSRINLLHHDRRILVRGHHWWTAAPESYFIAVCTGPTPSMLLGSIHIPFYKLQAPRTTQQYITDILKTDLLHTASIH